MNNPIEHANINNYNNYNYNYYTKENAFKPDMIDFVFAIAMFIIGYLFARWVLFTWRGWGVSVFTLAFLFTAIIYLIKKNVFNNNASTWFWFSITTLTGLSFALWGNPGMAFIRGLLLFCSAVYFILIASGTLLKGKTSNYLLMDGINAVSCIPFGNFINQYVSFKVLGNKQNTKQSKKLPIMLGVLFATVLFLILIPLLIRADSGGFLMIIRPIETFFNFVVENLGEIMFYVVFSIPISAYIYGLISGTIYKKNTDIINVDSVAKQVTSMRKVHLITTYITLGAVCGLYLVFILSQTPYFFSAFTGVKPEGWLIYSEFARQGFFELCAIAAINLIIITIANVTAKDSRETNRLLKLFNIILSVITLVIIATAFSKMVLYIDAYGLTMRRLLPCVFMIILAAVFVALIVLQVKKFSIVRFSVVFSSVLICILCLLNPDALVVRYNTDRFLNGTLRDYDVSILYRAGNAGVEPALDVYQTTTDEQLREDIRLFLQFQLQNGSIRNHTMYFERYRAVQMIENQGITIPTPTSTR